MEILINVALVGFASMFIMEFVGYLLEIYVDARELKRWLALPLAFGGIILLFDWQWEMIVYVPAAAFIGLALNRAIDRPIILQQVSQRRIN